MPLLIDGHNLIGAQVFDDIRLGDEDDEAKLVARLKVWRSRTRSTITVIFDRGIPGGRDVRMGGAGVEVIFAADPTEADDLIRRRLAGGGHKGLTLVTNDDVLIREARANGVSVWRGNEFVQRMTLATPIPDEPGTEDDVQLSAAEVDEWLTLFGGETKPKPKRGRKKGAKPPRAEEKTKPKSRRKKKRKRSSGKRR